MTPIRVLIADDHPVFRFGLRSLLESEPEFEIAGEAADGLAAVQMAAELEPDVVLMDITMPGMNGIAATKQLLESNPNIGVLVVTMVDDNSIFAALRAGARGYLLKGAEGEETMRAIRAVAAGEAIFSRGIGDRLVAYFAQTDKPRYDLFPELTEREHEVLDLMAQGLTNDAIADRLSLSPKTIRNQVSLIFSKLDVDDRTQAVLRAKEAGMG